MQVAEAGGARRGVIGRGQLTFPNTGRGHAEYCSKGSLGPSCPIQDGRHLGRVLVPAGGGQQRSGVDHLKSRPYLRQSLETGHPEPVDRQSAGHR